MCRILLYLSRDEHMTANVSGAEFTTWKGCSDVEQSRIHMTGFIIFVPTFLHQDYSNKNSVKLFDYWVIHNKGIVHRSDQSDITMHLPQNPNNNNQILMEITRFEYTANAAMHEGLLVAKERAYLIEFQTQHTFIHHGGDGRW